MNNEVLRIKKERESICTNSDKRGGKYGYKGRYVVSSEHRMNARIRGGKGGMVKAKRKETRGME